MNTTKKSSLENSPYQHARTSVTEPKPRRSRSTTSKSFSQPRSTRAYGSTEGYSSATKSGPHSHSKSAPHKRSSDGLTPRGPRRSSRSAPTMGLDSKPPRRSPRVKVASTHEEPSRSLAEDAEILRRFKSLMQQGSDNSNAPVVSDPYPNYEVDEMGNVIHQKGSNRPKAEVKVVVRRKRPFLNDGEDYDNEESDVNQLESDDQDYLEMSDELEMDQEAQDQDDELNYDYDDDMEEFPVIEEKPKRKRATKDSLASKVMSDDIDNDYDVQEPIATKAKRTRTSNNSATTTIQDEEIAPTESTAKTLSGVDDNLLRAAAIVFAQDPVMGVSKEQSLALGITSQVADAILQEQNGGKNKKKKNKLTPAQKAEAEAQAAAAAAQEAAAIVALSKRFSGRNISQAESSLQAMSKNSNDQEPEDNSNLSYKNSASKNNSSLSSTQALLNKLARTQAQLEKDDILPDSFAMSDEELDDTQFAKAATEGYSSHNKVKAKSYRSKSIVDIDDEFEDDNVEILTPKKASRGVSAKKETTKANTKNKAQATVVETKSTILNGANDTAITIEVKRRKSTNS